MNRFYRIVLVIPLFVLFSTITFAQSVGIGTNTPDSSAKLEISSTNSGLLLPRMTMAQRNAIRNPKAGLVVWCNDCGSGGEMSVYNGVEWKIYGGSLQSVGNPPATPTNLGAQVMPSCVKLFWTDAATNELGYKIERKRIGGNYSLIATVYGENIESYNDTSINSYYSYEYRIYAFNGVSSSSQYSNAITLTTIDVRTLSISQISCTQAKSGASINFRFSSGIDFFVEEAGICWGTSINPTYNLQTSASSLYYLPYGNSDLYNLSHVMTNLNPGTTYHVRAYAKTGNNIAYGQDIIFSTTSDYCNLVGNYTNTNHDFGSPYGPYTSRITNFIQTSPTTADIDIEKLFDSTWGPIKFTLDWTDSLNKTVSLQRQFDIAPATTVTSYPDYETWKVMVDASSTLGPGTFSFENQTLTLYMRVGIRNPAPPYVAGFFTQQLIVNMAR